ncbi:TetR/AcrR family transcriptional regulator [Bifidobacterium eulemuris]|uniref:AcrR family transcriptional regulator n=1 Tax=Bifidobacterium eulemuris TaxID=1765219 RepID=A0A261G420_9BIFI|nr:TetR/AcrR family transcriptional regulator [Bifidobacterium eulemuris]OZG65975.1 AcrR family transcriptional regulator [Bifidobacterium eulemuris]QOL32034.1 TetR/AcrR family transcriptional regulator [Bifidobacterium eulemuris]
MSRPRRDSEILPATTRMENAFWELLRAQEYRRITVTDIVREAGVNRNSFYYHYSGLPELADAAILHEVERTPLVEVPAPDQENLKHQWGARAKELISAPEQRQRLDRLALVAGSHSSPELLDSLCDFGRMTISSMLQLDTEHLDLKTDLMLDFAVGGLLSVLRRWPTLSETIAVEDLLNEDIAVLAMGMYLSMSKADMLDYWNQVFSNTVLAQPPDAADSNEVR